MGVADLNYKMSSKTLKEKREAFEAYISEEKQEPKLSYSQLPIIMPKPT